MCVDCTEESAVGDGIKARYSDGNSRTKKLCFDWLQDVSRFRKCISMGLASRSLCLLINTCLYNVLSCFAEIERIQKGETKKEPEKETYLDLFATKNLKLKERVLIPTKQYPRVRIAFSLELRPRRPHQAAVQGFLGGPVPLVCFAVCPWYSCISSGTLSVN